MESQRKNKPKIIVVLGPTASGKSDLAVSLAKKFNGEIVSADSRQVYKKMDIGSGKITEKEMQGIQHHLIDVASPKRRFTVARYRKLGTAAIEKILKQKKIPIVCGGTAFYLRVLIDGITVPEVSPDWQLRESLEKKSNKELFQELKLCDKRRAKEIDQKNRRRLIRAIEIIRKTKKPIPKTKKSSPFNSLFLGTKVDQESLNKKIDKRLMKRLEGGMINEVQELKKSGISWKRLESFGLEYKWVSKYLQKEINYQEMIDNLSTDIKKFSKRQLTWWKHDKRIKWIKNYREAERAVKVFLS